MKAIISITLALTLAATAQAQNAPAWAQPSKWAQMMEQNNTTLRALREQNRAERLAAGVEAPLPDPEVEVARMWGGASMPERTNVNVKQSLDWGTLSGRRRTLTKAAESVADGAYAEARRVLLAEAELAVVDMIYANKLCNELQLRLEQAEAVMQLYNRKQAAGDATGIEVNKVRLNRSMAAAELRRAEAERAAAAANVARLNGGTPLSIADTLYAAGSLPPLVEMQRHAETSGSALRAAEAEVKQRRSEHRLSKTLALPALTVGFTGEYLKDSKYSGVSLGLSLPVWSGSRRRVKQSGALATAAELTHADARLQLGERIARGYATAVALDASARGLQADLAALSNERLLRKALDEGQLTVLDYLLELAFYYEARTARLQAERDAEAAKAEVRGLCF